MKNNRFRELLYFVLFILIIFFAGSIFNPGRSTVLDKLVVRLDDLRKQLGLRSPATQQYSTDILTQEVVEEDSQIVRVVERVSPAVVSVVVKTTNFDPFNGPTIDESGIGTGFIVDRNGLVVTNSHVVDRENGQYSVVLKDGTTYDVNKVHLDRQNDLAILEIAARNLPYAELGDSDSLKVGQRAVAIGNALGQFQNTVTTGVISGIGRSITAGGGFGTQPQTYESVLQTDAAINPGNSGGPLLNIAGQVIGINVATSSGADNISFAIPVSTLKPDLESFLNNGRIIKPYMGVSYQMIGKEISALRRLPQGAFVLNVGTDTPADKAGLERSDIITKFDGRDLGESLSLARAISTKKVGDKVTVEIDRSGDRRTLEVSLAEMPQNL